MKLFKKNKKGHRRELILLDFIKIKYSKKYDKKPLILEDVYNKDFYVTQKYSSYRSAIEVCTLLIPILPKIKSVADFSCGVGTWLKAWNDLDNNIKIIGFDINNLPDEQLFISREFIKRIDITNSSAFDNIKEKFDIVESLEVAEHFDAQFASEHVSALTKMSDIILFSAAAPRQTGTHHINEQPPAYWSDLFEKEGYVCFDILRAPIWNNTNISWWYRQNIMLYIKKDKENILTNQGFTSTKEPNLYYHPESLKRYKEV